MMLSILISALRRLTNRPPAAVRGLHSVRRFRQTLARERARSDRSGDGFSLLVFTPPESASAPVVHRQLAKVLRRRLRSIDEAGWIDDQRIGALLPLTPATGAWKVARDVVATFDPARAPAFKVYSYPSQRAQEAAGQSDEQALANGDEPAAHALELLLAQSLPVWKRCCDVAGAVFGLAVLSPVLLLAALCIKLSSPGPVLFRQRRTGLGGRPFVIYKFRSMVIDAETKKAGLMAQNEQDGPAFKIKADPRVTWIGRILRSTSIDELPQLWNVLKGDMSLVGPRPLPCHESDACLMWQRSRLDVTPGLTCIWQVWGRSSVSFNDWIRMDLTYIRRRSLWNDLKIIFATVTAVVLRRGAQ